MFMQGSLTTNRLRKVGFHFLHSNRFALSTIIRRSKSIQAGGFAWPLASKAHKGGEDAFFIQIDRENYEIDPSTTGAQRRLVCGVADGVGGSKQPDVYANALMESCKAFARDNPSVLNPKEILQGVWEANSALRDGTIDGSSTACLVSLVLQENYNLELHCANVGDSGFVMIRKNQGLYRSKPQLHGPNTPFQLGPNSDTPAAADETSVLLEPGDVIAVCTDGIFDNLFLNHVSLILHGLKKVQEAITWLEQQQNQQDPTPLQQAASFQIPVPVPGSRQEGDPECVQVAQTLCAHAKAIYQSEKYCMTPFDAEQFHYSPGGGKMDDATAVVIQV